MNAEIPRQEVAWSTLAARWDTAGAAWNGPVAERLVELADLQPGMAVLDAGCGTGAASIPAARAVAPGGQVTGIDTAAAMITRARRQAAHAGITNAIFCCEDAARLPYEPASFDAVIASLVVYLLPRPAAALTGWHRLLRRLGVLAFSWVAAEDPAWEDAFTAVDTFLPEPQRWSAYRRQWTVPEAEDLLPQEMTGIITVTEPVISRYTSMDHWWQSAWTQAPALAWQHITPSQRGDACQAAFTKLQKLPAADGSLQRVRTVCYTMAKAA